MSQFNLNRSHPIIPQLTTKETESHYVSISSQDRNLIKNPDSDDFSIELPQEYYNVESVKLASAYFPIVDNQFSTTQNNVDLCFRFTRALNPLDISGVTIQNALSFLFVSETILRGSYFRIRIRDGRYSKYELANEIYNRMNQIVTEKLARRINGTARIREWGDFVFILSYFVNAQVGTDLSPFTTSDNNNIYYNNQFKSLADAIVAFNAKYGTSFDIPNFENRAGAVTLDITMSELNTYSQNCSPTEPPILMSWPGALPRQLDEYIDLNNETNTEFLADQIWDGERNLDPNWESILKEKFLDSGGYQHFKMIVDEVSTRFNLANTVDDFEIITDKENYYSLEVLNIINNIRDDFNTYQANLDTTTFMPRQANDCANVEYYIDDLKWGLPVYLGLDGTEVTEEYKYDTGEFLETKGFYLPTYYYYNKTDSRYQPFKRPESGGFAHSSIFLLVPKFQLDVKGEPYFFMDLDRLNCIDEVAPYKENEFSEMNNMSTGNPNSAFAKLPLSIQDEVAYSGSQITSKSYDPPLNRLSRLAIRLRFHNGRPVKFGIQPFSFVLEIKCSKQSLKLK